MLFAINVSCEIIQPEEEVCCCWNDLVSLCVYEMEGEHLWSDLAVFCIYQSNTLHCFIVVNSNVGNNHEAVRFLAVDTIVK